MRYKTMIKKGIFDDVSEDTELQNQYEKESRMPSYVHHMWIPEGAAMPSWGYVRWLEAKVEAERRTK